MVLLRGGEPLAGSIVAGLLSGSVVSAAGTYRLLTMSGVPSAHVYVLLVWAPAVLGVILLFDRTWRPFGIGLVFAPVVVTLLSFALIAYTLSRIGS